MWTLFKIFLKFVPTGVLFRIFLKYSSLEGDYLTSQYN
jgi:hypothetical protein